MTALAAFVSPGRAPLMSTAHRAGVAETLGYDLVLTNHIANRDGDLSLPFYRRMLERAGFAGDIERFDAGGAEGRDAAVAAISEEMARALAAIGTAEAVRAILGRYRDAGVTLPGIGPLTADGTVGFEATLAAAIGRDLDPSS